MENIQVPRVQQILNQVQQVEMYTWFCTCLKEYATVPFIMYGAPAPIVLAKRISYDQLTDHFGMAEMKDLLQPLCNAAFFLNIQVSRDATFSKDFPKRPSPMFDRTLAKEIWKMNDNLEELLLQHRKLMSYMRSIQQKCQHWKQQIAHRASKTGTFLNSCTEDDMTTKLSRTQNKIQNLKSKQELATKRFEKEMERFRNAMQKEKDIREQIHQTTQTIKEKMIFKIKEGLQRAVSDLTEAVKGIQSPQGFSHTMNQLWDVNVDRMAERLYDVHCRGYATPVPEDFLIATGYNESLPTINIISPEVDKLQVSSRCHTGDEAIEFLDPFQGKSQQNQDTCFFEKTGGVRVVIKKNLPVPAMYGIIGVKKGQEVKAKLSLFNGKIGFGWTRERSPFATKKWGFFYLSKDEYME